MFATEQSDSGQSVDWLSPLQHPPKVLPADTPTLRPLLLGANDRPIRSLDRWKAHRQSIRRWWDDFLGSLEIDRQHAPLLKVLQEDRIDQVVRQRVSYEIEPGMTTEAYLLKPQKIHGRRPGVVVHHSTVNHSIRQPAGVEGRPEKAFGYKLAQKGYVTFCPRNFLWSTNDKIEAKSQAQAHLQRHPQTKGMAKMLFNSQVAVDILSSLAEVDSDRIGAVGHSLGAKEVLYLAAMDERIKVTVSSEGGIGTRFSNWHDVWYLGPAIKQPSFDHEHHELLALVAPRAFLLLGGDSADGDRSWPFILEAMKVYQLYSKTPKLGLLNHKQGHAVPPIAERRIYQWFDAYL